MEMPEYYKSPDEMTAADIGLDLLLRSLEEELGLNFKQYKPNYLKRRIGVRMRAKGCSDYMQYRQCIRQDSEEGGRLLNELTINVTEFFRDQEVYEAIREQVLPETINYKKETGILSIRGWSAGCATGEEPYSLSMLFLDALKKESAWDWALRITASDLDDKVIKKAKDGSFEEAKVLPGMSLDEYFDREKGQYLVKEEVRRPVRFVILDLMKPPPLRHLDIVLCRNVLIYFEKSKQYRILSIFNNCLRKGGFLILGKSEAIMGAGDTGFIPFNRKERIYRKEKDMQEAASEKPRLRSERRGVQPPDGRSHSAPDKEGRSNSGTRRIVLKPEADQEANTRDKKGEGHDRDKTI